MEDHTIKYRVPSEDHEEMKRILASASFPRRIMRK